jgi:endoglucanase
VDVVSLRGLNLGGLAGGYGGNGQWDRASGPVAGRDYPVHSTKLIDYFKTKGVGVIRLLFSWERMQSKLWGPLPAAGPGYAAYFTNFKNVVDYATSLGIVVIIEPWQADASGGAGGAMWRGELVGSANVNLYAFADLWKKLATIFKDNKRVEYGLVNEPNHMSTMVWWTIAQKCIDYIRAAGATTNIYVPGNGYSGPEWWTQDWYDTASPKRSNAYGWLNVNGVGRGLWDPLKKSVAEVHLYLNADSSGSTTGIVSQTIARERLSVALNEAAAHGYRIFVGEIGCYAGNQLASAAWADFVKYVTANSSVCTGYTWWAAGWPGWWDDVAANGGGHFSITPTKVGAVYSGDTINMTMIEHDFV